MTDHLLTFRVTGDANDVRDLGNLIREAILDAQRVYGQHLGVVVEGPMIELRRGPAADGTLDTSWTY